MLAGPVIGSVMATGTTSAVTDPPADPEKGAMSALSAQSWPAASSAAGPVRCQADQGNSWRVTV